ncbi:pilus assembly protein TadG [Prosthecomicrobium hirschii]|nr:pilus assembly protein TadG [Prosthecomicrobium hirschii]
MPGPASLAVRDSTSSDAARTGAAGKNIGLIKIVGIGLTAISLVGRIVRHGAVSNQLRCLMIRSVPASLLRLAQDRRGSLTSSFALLTVPVLAMLGGMLDFGVVTNARGDMQNVLDAAALAVAKDAGNMTEAQVQTAVQAYFNSTYTSKDVTGITVSAKLVTGDAGDKSVTVTGTGSVKTTFLGLLGIEDLTFSTSATATWGSTRLRVALVLDNTGSMSKSGKMTALKSATKSLLTQLKAAATNTEDVYVSIIPFARDVNVGAGNVNATWIRWTEWESENGTWSWVKSGWNWYQVWTPANHNTWTGCVMDRDQDYDTTDTAPTTATSGTLYPAEQYSDCPAAVMALSNNWTSLNSKVDEMQPNGNTNQGIGLQWGFASLTKGPLAIPSKDSKYKYTDAIVLFTDGLNTENRWSSRQSSIDARQKKTCTNVKAAGIVLYTVQVDTSGSDGVSTLLQDCATDTSKYFMLTSADQIISTFQSIGTSLSQLRLSK